MPGGDRTGPMGAGSMTGRGMGVCAGNARPGFGRGRGFGLGRQGCLPHDRIAELEARVRELGNREGGAK